LVTKIKTTQRIPTPTNFILKTRLYGNREDNAKYVKVLELKPFVTMGMSKVARNVLDILEWQLMRQGQDTTLIEFSENIRKAFATEYETAMQNKCPVNKSAFYQGRQELLDKGILKEAARREYLFVNPVLWFNGNRLTYIANEQTKLRVKEVLEKEKAGLGEV